MDTNEPRLTPKHASHTITSTGKGMVILNFVESRNRIEFTNDSQIVLEIERDLNQDLKKESFNTNTFRDIDNPTIAFFPLKHLAFDSYCKITAVDKSKEKVDFDLWITYQAFDQ